MSDINPLPAASKALITHKLESGAVPEYIFEDRLPEDAMQPEINVPWPLSS
jgi:hypothetical protein